jgi:hypothetical protein
VYFTSVREEKGQPFTIRKPFAIVTPHNSLNIYSTSKVRSKIVCDNGIVLHLRDA